ncbi:hypothetical protein HWV00_01205 [Moritella sp. 24]|nr:hypothetical protein [Moritella sp. 24]QUM74977.1 hypothetical protein HWV00_01205 [Moritella sp. 24]
MEQQQVLQNHLIAIEMYICHLGKTFEEACDELNLDITVQLALKNIMEA